MESSINNLESQSEIIEPKSEIIEPKSEKIEPKSEIIEPKSEKIEPKSEIIEPKSEIIEPKSEIIESKSEIIEHKSEIIEKEERKFLYYYFIENHIDLLPIKIELENLDIVKDLELLKQGKFEEDDDIYLYSIYRFKLLQLDPKEQKEIIIILKDKSNNQSFNSKIKIEQNKNDIFLYDVKFNPNNSFLNIEYPPKSYYFTHQQQFEFYVDYLRKDLKIKIKSKENINLILSTVNLLRKEYEKYDFSFYLMIFKECSSCPVIRELLMEFKPEKIGSKGVMIKEKLKQLKNIILVYQKNPLKILNNIENEEDKKICRFNLFTMILFFHFLYNKEEYAQLLEQKINKEDIYLSLLKYDHLFKSYKLSKEQIQNLIDLTTNFNQLQNALIYNNNILDLFEIIDYNYNKLEKLFKKVDIEKKNKSKKSKIFIDIESIVTPKNTDNLEKISKIYLNLMKLQLDNLKKIFLVFSPSLFAKYIDLFEQKNFNNLFHLKKMIDKTKKELKDDFKFKIDIENIIHETGIKLCLEHKLKNIEILDFVSKDSHYKKSEHKSLKFLKGINFSLIDGKFLKKWKEINWEEKLSKNEYKIFLKNICESIVDIKNFKLLFNLFNTNKEENSNELVFSKQALDEMINKFEKLMESFNIDMYKEDLINLIYYCEINKKDIEGFLVQKVHNLIETPIVNNIYFELITKYKEKISEKTKNIITNFFIENKNNSNSKTLLYIIDNCPELSRKIIERFENYYIRENEFWVLEESDNLKLYAGLLERGYFSNINQESIEYIDNTVELVRKLENDLKNGEVLYPDISIFYNNENKNELSKRLLLISLNDKMKANELEKNLDENIIKIKKVIKELQLIYEDLSEFLYETEKENIKQINEIITSINKGPINCFENNYAEKYSDLINNFGEKAQKRALKKKSLFFGTIYKIKAQKYKQDSICINQTESEFNKLVTIFSNEGIQSLDQDILQICLKTIKGKKREEINKEIEVLIEIFKGDLMDSIYDKEKIIESLIILSKKEDIYNAAVSISLFLDRLGVKKDTFYQKLINIKSILKNSNRVEIILRAIEDLKYGSVDINILYEETEKDNYLNILLKFREEPDSIKFLFENTIEVCRNLQERVGEIDNNFLTSNDILAFEKCIEFMSKLGNEQTIKNKNDIEVIKSFKKEVENYKSIELYFNKYINNYQELNSFIKYAFDKSEASKQKIKLICQNSVFILNSKGKFFEGAYYEINESDPKKVSINLGELIELRDRAQLSKKIAGDTEELKLLETNKKFIEKVSEIYNLYSLLENINTSGYPEDIEIKIIIVYSVSEFFVLGQKKESFQILISELKAILYELKNAQIKAYKEKPLIRFIYGRQFILIYNHLKKKEKDKIKPFLMFFTNNLMKYSVNDFEYKTTSNRFEDIINNSENYLENVLLKNNLNLELIYKDSLINEKYNFKGVYMCQSSNLEKDLFQIYKYLTKNTPIAQNMLLCNKDTSNEELTAFLYRAIFCEFNSCFMIGGIEFLEFEQKSKLLELLNNLFVNAHEKMKSCLVILYTINTSDIYISLDLLKYKEKLNLKENEVKNIKIEDSNIEIISSDKSGVGKSTQIKMEIQKGNKNYIYFPFGGVFNREDVIERLNNLEFSNNTTIHLDLYDTDQTSLMTEFLFSILITKLYGHNENIFYLSKDVEIKIEIPNGFINYIQKFPLLTLFPKRKLLIKNLAPLIINENIQIVANYLKALKNNILTEKDIFFKGITPYEFSRNRIVSEELSQSECQELIFEEIKKTINEPNYYQIKSFVDILTDQFKRFNRNFFINEYNDINDIRTDLIESFIKNTKYFTKGAFTEIIASQEQTHKLLSGEYNPEKATTEGLETLSTTEHDIISFDKIDPSLIFFHEGTGQGFSIITNLEKEEEIDEPNEDNINQNGNNQGKRLNSEYAKLYKLLNSQEETIEKRVDLPKYKTYKPMKFLYELKEILELKNPVEKEKKKENDVEDNNNVKINLDEDEDEDEEEEEKKEENEEKKKSLEEIAGTYVFTADNFVKMILILLRIRVNIPVIMMGETGCGKTSLIRKLSQLLNNGSSRKMKILNIHAGTTDKDIIEFIQTKVINEARELEIQENKNKINFLNQGQIYEPRKLWIFLDEINTCKSMGLISELMCKHTCQGNPLPENIVFIAACNPYRHGKKRSIGLDVNQAHKEKQSLDPKDLGKLKNSNTSLVYTVNPLPHSLLNFVFDFGNLTPKDEKSYIESIILDPIQKINLHNGNKSYKDIHKLAKKLISKAQNYIRKRNDISSVSLREIRRFNIFFKFFFKYLMKKKEKKSNLDENIIHGEIDNYYQNLDQLSLQKFSVILSVFVCYYLRITDNEGRKQLQDIMNETLRKLDIYFIGKDFLEIPEREELYIANNIELGKGIAKNRALLDNIFSLFVAINNKVPIFIVGKPGCSKSLSVQLINKAMKGSTSNNHLFKELPKIILNSYQGSMSSTSQGVLNVFEKARKVLANISDKKERKNNISVIYFDEMGLAEHSPNNPLKVIHSQLEYDQNKGIKKVGFVGISNWVLDASKMNRGMFLSIPDPSEDDAQKTAFTIGQSYDENTANHYKVFFENLGLTYYKYKNYLKIKHSKDGKEDFHGNRDFYHLIKNAARNLVDNIKNINDDSLEKIVISSIERNFSGLQLKPENSSSLKVIKGILKEFYPNCTAEDYYRVLDRIKENVNDINSRYLLVISKSSVSAFLLSSILSDLGKEYNLYIGSQFPNDIKSEEYSLKILNKIQIHMEQERVLILKNLESVYPALYDLFNQNFTEVSKKNYARIAIGSTTNTFSFVNNNFRCIVNVDYDQIDQEEAPFLNRFEKHIISFEYLLNQEMIDESKKIYNKLNELITFSTNIYKGINYSLKNIFINFDLEEIEGIIYTAQDAITKENMLSEVISKISLILPQDILFCMKFNGFQSKNPQIAKKIIEAYDKGEHSNMRKFLEKMEKEKNCVYTFSNNLDIIENLDKIYNNKFGEFNKDNIKQIKISSYRSENEFEKEIDDFLGEPKYKLCFIKFNSNEGSFLNYVKFFIENKEKDLIQNKRDNSSKKIFVFIVYLKRIFNEELKNYLNKTKKEQKYIDKKFLKETISLLSGYYQIFIDNLNGIGEINLEKMLQLKGLKFFENFLDFDEELKKNIYTSLSYVKYNIPFGYGELNEDTYVNKLIDFIEKKESKELRDNINNCIKSQLDNNEDLLLKIFKVNNLVNPEDRDLIQIIKKYLLNEYKKLLNHLYLKAEKDNFFASLLSAEEEKKSDNHLDDGNDNLKLLREKTNTKYFEKFVTNNNIRIVEEPGKNVINIILGLKLPGLKPAIESLLIYIKQEVEKKYKKNENKLRKGTNDEKIKTAYDKELELLNNSLYVELSKNDLIVKLKEGTDKYFESELEEILSDDFYTLFIYKNITAQEKDTTSKLNNIKDVKEMLKYLVNLKYENNNNESEPLRNFSNKMNWIQCYSIEITTILQMFSKLNKIIKGVFGQIKQIIEKRKTEYKISGRSNTLSAIVNEVFFLGMESILRVVTSNKEIYVSFKDDPNKFSELMNINKDILQSAFKLEANLKLFTKEAFSLEEILELNKCFYELGIDTVNNISKIIEFFSNETLYLLRNNEKELINNFNTLYHFLEEKIGKYKNFPKVMSIIFKNEYLKTENEAFTTKLLEIIISKDEFIFNCSHIFKKIFSFSVAPEDMKNYLDNLKTSTSSKLKVLNESKGEYLDETIINLYEYKILLFFENIPKFLEKDKIKEDYKLYFKTYYDKLTNSVSNAECCIIYDLTNEIFNNCLELLDSIVKGRAKINNSNLCKLFAITYIKIYLSKLVSFIIEDYESMSDISKIFYEINNADNDFRKVVKFYIFKLFFNSLNKNWEDLTHSRYEFFQNMNLNFKDNSEQDNSQIDSFIINYHLLINNEKDENNFLEKCKKFEALKIKHFNSSEVFSLDNDNIDFFLTISINKIISNLGLKKNTKISEYSEFSKFCENQFSDLDTNLKNLLFLLYNEKKYNEILKPKIEPNISKQFNGEIFESLLYGFRFCVQSLLIKNSGNDSEKYLYSSILSSECLGIINESYIPGNDSAKNLIIESLEEIEEHLNNKPADTGCYVCSCGYYYPIPPCGFPTRGYTSNCPVCNLPIGFGEKIVEGGEINHGMVVRPGHYRIFKNIKQKVSEMSKWNDPDENIPNILLEDYKKQIVEPLLNKANKGINVVFKEIYLNNNRNVRKLSQIGFRLLNFILYNHLFFANCLNFISFSDLSEKLVIGMNILEIIQINWDLLGEALQQKNILSTQIFINLIFKDLSNLVKNCKFLKEESELFKFEENVEKIIQENILKYPEYSIKYKAINQNQLSLKSDSPRAIISEILPPIEEIYPESEYPLLKYFTFTKYRKIEDFIKSLGPKEDYVIKHPLLYNYLTQSETTKKLKYLPDFNEFTNFMVDYYSYQISRKEALTKPLEKEPIFNKISSNLYSSFSKAWNNIYEYATKYKCRKELTPRQLQKSDNLIYFLNDDNEEGYLAAACHSFINWQNSFLLPIIETSIFYGNLNYYVENMNNKIPVQEANPNQILSIEDCFKNSDYNDFEDLIYTFSKREIFEKDGKINYLKYNIYKYDFSSIEEELGKLILPEKCLFEGEENLNFITFWGEGFRGGKSEILSKFYSKYKQNDLTEDEKTTIFAFINKFEKRPDKIKTFFSSIQLIIFYLTNNSFKTDEKLNTILTHRPEYLKINEDCLNFFSKEGNIFKVNQLMNIFFYIEHLCFEDLKKIIHPIYQKGIDENVILKIKEKIKNEKTEEKEFRIALSSALRRFISRYIAGISETIDIDENIDLAFQLGRIDLWEEKYGKFDNLDEKITEYIKSFNLKVANGFKFYELIGDEDKKLIEENKKKIIGNNEGKKSINRYKKHGRNRNHNDGEDEEDLGYNDNNGEDQDMGIFEYNYD